MDCKKNRFGVPTIAKSTMYQTKDANCSETMTQVRMKGSETQDEQNSVLVQTSKFDACLNKMILVLMRGCISVRSVMTYLLEKQLSDTCMTRLVSGSPGNARQTTSIRRWAVVQHARVIAKAWNTHDICNYFQLCFASSLLQWAHSAHWRKRKLQRRFRNELRTTIQSWQEKSLSWTRRPRI